ncbi:MAG: DNA internalization-related competence protein ComEC/Rec2 [bacterium]|nr:DNA internalization-related competence protein ComEC/Rec2 [bacterium]
MALLYICHQLNPYSAVIQPVIIVTFFTALVCYILKKFKLSYVFIALSISLLITTQFLKEKEDFLHITQPYSQFHLPEKDYITIYGKLAAFPEIHPDHSILYVDTHRFEFKRKKIAKTLSIRVKVTGNLKDFFKGDRVVIDARIYRNRFNRNFYPNGMENYILSKKTHFTGYCKSPRLATVEQKASLPWRIIGKWRNSIRNAIEKKYGEKNGELDKKGVFLQAILLGERGKLGNTQKEQLLNAGVFHLLAISGAHIGIIALFSLMFLGFLKISVRKRYIITGLLLVVFLILSGFKVSAERAVLMALLIFISRLLYLEVDIFNIISFAGLLILIRNPAQFLDAGFILTFTLTAAIVMGRKIFLPLLSKLKTLRLNTFTYINELLSANLSAAVISLPLSLFYFKRYSFAGFFAGLLLLPLTAVITAGGMLLLPLAPVSAGLSNLLLTVLDIPLRLFFHITAFFSNGAGFFTIFRPSPPVLLVVVVLIAFCLLSVGGSRTRKILLGLFLVGCLFYMSANLFYYEPENLEVFYLDVGQGDSQVVVFPGGDALLIDGGGVYHSDFQVGRNIVLPFLLQRRIKVKWVAVSHFHPDHAKGLAEIIGIIEPEELWISSEAEGNLYYDGLMAVVPGSTAIKKLHAPFVRKIGSCSVEFLAPPRLIETSRPHNNHSQVIKVSDSYRSFLFVGDIEVGVERELVERNCSKLGSEVLKVPHHGSRTSSTFNFLECVGPEFAVFSYSRGNRFNFPHEGAMRNYRVHGIKYLSTACSGGIRFISLPGSIKIETSR